MVGDVLPPTPVGESNRRAVPRVRPDRSPAVEAQSAGSDLQQRYRQFLDLLPLTVALAGLPTSETRLYSEEQIEARAMTVKAAYRVARTTAKECLSGS